jgi:hypothetical protein
MFERNQDFVNSQINDLTTRNKAIIKKADANYLKDEIKFINFDSN